MQRRPQRSPLSSSSAASDVYKRQAHINTDDWMELPDETEKVWDGVQWHPLDNGCSQFIQTSSAGPGPYWCLCGAHRKKHPPLPPLDARVYLTVPSTASPGVSDGCTGFEPKARSGPLARWCLCGAHQDLHVREEPRARLPYTGEANFSQCGR
eukprot:TRINITY_DN40943_c0_g1_i1.p1 TRINITY_DN40943_c0_g1~~TRINITY_DN40943_c0_g1_i1.p1  ORF type:complete len:153 (-),score=22.21 TRINITY_DN40943_c0_g1_i1:126-584(-)